MRQCVWGAVAGEVGWMFSPDVLKMPDALVARLSLFSCFTMCHTPVASADLSLPCFDTHVTDDARTSDALAWREARRFLTASTRAHVLIAMFSIRPGI